MIFKCKLKKFVDYIRYDVPAGFSNLITWFPVIWKDRNWDHYFIYVMLRHKLHLMEQLIRHHGMHVNNIKDADGIKKCVLLLDRLIADEYGENAFMPHDKKWGKAEMSWHDIDDEPEMCSLEINRSNVKTEEDKKEERKSFKRCSDQEQLSRQQDIEMLFESMKKKIEGWWD